MLIIKPIEYFKPKNIVYDEVTLIDAFDSFTHNLVQLFLSLNTPVTVFRSKNIPIDTILDRIGGYLVLSPGPGTPSQAGILKKIIPYVYNKIPILGVCLGMQAVNEVFEGKTVKSEHPIHGMTSKISHDGTGIFTNIPSPMIVARYHSLTVKNVSTNFKIQSIYNKTIMAFNMSNKIATTQFHPESFLTPYGSQIILNFLDMRL